MFGLVSITIGLNLTFQIVFDQDIFLIIFENSFVLLFSLGKIYLKVKLEDNDESGLEDLEDNIDFQSAADELKQHL